MTTRPTEGAPGAGSGAELLRRARAAGRGPLPTDAALAIVAVAGLVAAALILWNYRGLTFFYDEWDFVQGRRDWDVDAFLAAHNEHLAIVTALIFKILFVTVGLTSYWPYAVVLVVSHLACAGALFALLRHWSSNEAAVLGTTVLLFLGSGWGILLWPFEVAVTVSLAAGLAAILALEQGTRRGDVAACLLLALCLASASLGVPIAIGMLALMLARPRWRRRLWVVGAPAALYAAWFLVYGDSTGQAENVQQIPIYSADAAAAALAGVFGMNPEIGRSIMVATVVATIAAVLGRWAARDRVTLVVLAAGVMWALLCLSRFGVGTPAEPRYVYPGAALMILLLGALVGHRAITAPRARVVGVVLVAASLMTNIGVLRSGSVLWRDYSGQVRAALGAMTEVRDHVPADFAPAPRYGPQIRAAAFFAAADDLGSPAWTADEIRSGPANARNAADDVLRRAGAISLEGAPAAATGPRPPAGIEAGNGEVRPGPGRGCATATPIPGAVVTARLGVPAAGLQVRSAGGPTAAVVGVRVARFADLPPAGEPMASAPPDATTLLVMPRLGVTSQWRLEAASEGPVVICGVG